MKNFLYRNNSINLHCPFIQEYHQKNPKKKIQKFFKKNFQKNSNLIKTTRKNMFFYILQTKFFKKNFRKKFSKIILSKNFFTKITPCTYTIHFSKNITGNTSGFYANPKRVNLEISKHLFSLLIPVISQNHQSLWL